MYENEGSSSDEADIQRNSPSKFQFLWSSTNLACLQLTFIDKMFFIFLTQYFFRFS